MVEVVVAIALLAMVAVGFAKTTGNALELTGAAKERQTATQFATTAIEEARAVPFDQLAVVPLAADLEGAGTPDEDVSGGSYTGELGSEVLVERVGGLEHRDGTEISGVQYEVYRYVTEVGSGGVTKRVSVVVTHGDSQGGKVRRVALSAIMGKESVAFGGTTTTTTVSSTTSTSTSTTSTTAVPGVCGGDATPPTAAISVLAGTGANQGYTGSSSVGLSLAASDPCGPITIRFSNDGITYSASEPFATSKVWPLSAGDGDKTVHYRAMDGAGNITQRTGSVRLDSSKPTTPGSFALFAATSPRRVQLSWSPSTDTDKLVGYRIFRKVNATTFVNLPPGVTTCSTSCSITDGDVKNKNTYTYYVVSYDAAGNQSVATSSLSKSF